jgi:hypothetical protein
MIRIGFVSILIFSGALSACSRRDSDVRSEVQARGRDRPVAMLTLSVPRSHFVEGEKIIAMFSVRNVAGHPLWINRRLAFNDKTAPAELREVWIDVSRPDGGQNYPDCVSRSLPATDADYALLASAEVISTRETINCLNLSAGQYLIVAHYKDGSTRPPYPPNGAAHLAAELLSPPVTLEVVKKPR